MKNNPDQPTAAGPSEGSRRTPDSNARGGTRWTPGPWENVRDDFIEAKSGAIVVEQINNDLEEVEDGEITANAQLIAAAPELYEALTELLAWEAVCGTPEEHGAKCERRRDAQEQARAALAKARGETAPDALTRESGANPPGRLGQ